MLPIACRCHRSACSRSNKIPLLHTPCIFPPDYFLCFLYMYKYIFTQSSLGKVTLTVMPRKTPVPKAIWLLQCTVFGDLLNDYPVGHSVSSCRSCTPTSTILDHFMQHRQCCRPVKKIIGKEKPTAPGARRRFCSLFFFLCIDIFRDSWPCVRKRVRTAAVFSTLKCGCGPDLLSKHNVWTPGSDLLCCMEDSHRRRA